MHTLIICYGNPGRLDDGIGASFGALLQEKKLPGLAIDIDYQLGVEHAAAIADYQFAVFVDAAVSGPEPFFIERLAPQTALSFSSHSVDPASLLALSRDLFGADTTGFALGIRGYEFNAFGERLSSGARHNIQLALEAIAPALQRRELNALVRRLKSDFHTSAQLSSERTIAVEGDPL